MNPDRINKARPVSQHTFGTPEALLRAPTPQRAASMSRDSETRPTLIRSQTPIPAAEDQAEIAKMFASNMFADPAPQKAYGKFGPRLFTDGHERLLFILREECGRLFSFNKSLKEKLSSAEKTIRSQTEQNADLRAMYHTRGERCAQLASELRDAQDALQEMDQMLSETRNKRLSRLGRVNFEDLGEQIN